MGQGKNPMIHSYTDASEESDLVYALKFVYSLTKFLIITDDHFLFNEEHWTGGSILFFKLKAVFPHQTFTEH